MIAPEKLFGRILAVWLTMVFAGATVLLLWDMPARFRLASHSAMTTARVSALDCSNHGQVVYAYNVGTTRYSGKGKAPSDDCAASRVGEPKTIYYDVKNPSYSADNPHDVSRDFVLRALFLVFMAWGLAFKAFPLLWKVGLKARG